MTRLIELSTRQVSSTDANAFLVGSGIASLAAAVLLVRDARFSGKNIHIFEQLDVLGGSLDGSGDADQGFVTRGGRMFEKHFACTYDLLSQIPSLANPEVSVTQEIKRFTEQVVTSSNCRLVEDAEPIEAPTFQLSFRDRLDLIRLSLLSETSVGEQSIQDYFSPHFLQSNFWIMWCTMFAFQPWHSLAEFRRYMKRFMHLLPGFSRLEGIHRTRLNQNDSVVRPLVEWLATHGVSFHPLSSVISVDFNDQCQLVTGLRYRTENNDQNIAISPDDRVLITLGSMTESSELGTMTAAPARPAEDNLSGAWALWRQIAKQSNDFGKPECFASDTDKTLWTSFTVTLRNPVFFDFMQSFTTNPAGTGGLVTFKNSSWMLSVVLAHQPHFANQPENAHVFWGYGLHPNALGDRVKKPMLECNGEEILLELAYHLQIKSEDMFSSANCIPCLMPYITSQFMPRHLSARPQVIPAGARNFGFLGQFCELPEDTVFTVEYSVRSAQTAVYGLCKTDRTITPMFRGFEQPRIVSAALQTITMNGRI